VADIDVPEAREPVDVLLALGVDQEFALGADDDERLLVLLGVVQRVDQVLLVGFDDLAIARR
jgi:hypothetical protein